MKSLTIFLIISILLSCYVNTFQQTNEKKKKADLNQKEKKKFSLANQKKKMELNKGDFEVCQTGKNLGLLESGMTCSYKYSNFCEKIVKRDKNLPPQSKFQKAKLASSALKDSKKSLTILKRKKKWTLKGRTKKFQKKKTTKNSSKFRKISQKNREKNKKLRQLKKEARLVADKIFSKAKSFRMVNKKSSKKNASKILNNIISGNINAAKRSLNLPTNKKRQLNVTKSEKKDTGKFCVQSVVWNLSHCCHFTSRIEAENFANTQPIESKFNRQLVEGWYAQMKDNRKTANKVINKATDAMKVFEKTRKQRKANINAGLGKITEKRKRQ